MDGWIILINLLSVWNFVVIVAATFFNLLKPGKQESAEFFKDISGMCWFSVTFLYFNLPSPLGSMKEESV